MSQSNDSLIISHKDYESVQKHLKEYRELKRLYKKLIIDYQYLEDKYQDMVVQNQQIREINQKLSTESETALVFANGAKEMVGYYEERIKELSNAKALCDKNTTELSKQIQYLRNVIHKLRKRKTHRYKVRQTIWPGVPINKH